MRHDWRNLDNIIRQTCPLGKCGGAHRRAGHPRRRWTRSYSTCCDGCVLSTVASCDEVLQGAYCPVTTISTVTAMRAQMTERRENVLIDEGSKIIPQKTAIAAQSWVRDGRTPRQRCTRRLLRIVWCHANIILQLKLSLRIILPRNKLHD